MANSEASTPERAKRGSSTSARQEARRLIWSHRYRLATGLALVAVSRLAGMVLPASSKWLIDEVIGNGRGELLAPIALAVAAATAVEATTSFALSQVLGVAAQRAIAEMRKRVQQHVTRLPVSFFDSRKSGELISRVMTDAEGIRNLVGTGLVQLIGGLFTAAIALVVLLYLNWRLTLFNLVALATFAGLMAVAFNRLRPLFRERGELNAQVTGRLGESLGGVRLVKAYTAERREDLAFARGVHRLFRNVAKAVTGVALVGSFSGLIIGTIGVLMLLIGGRAVLAGEMTLGDLMMYVFFTSLMIAPLVQISAITTQLSEAFAGLDRIRELRRLTTEADEEEGRRPVKDLRGDLAFEAVSFEYEPGVPVLRNISFRAPAGSTTALVGPSGSGKSTLTSLVLTFNLPTAGRVTVDGEDLAGLRLHDYRSHVGVVLQDNFLFDGTIADNIRYGRPNASREEIERVGRIAHCEEFVAGFEKGYDTVVGERGVKLSGGQRQRVAIARAVLADPKILILDEATSSLDSESEALIQDGLRSLRSGRTTFVIAHRLSTIRSADQILVLEDGEIVERGTHGELLAAGGRYKQLHDKQYHLETDRFINPGEDFTPELEPVAAAAPAAGGRPTDL